MFIAQFVKGNKIAPSKIQNVINYAHAQLLNAYNICLSKNSITFIRMLIGEFLKGNKIAPLKIQNGINYAHAQLLRTCSIIV